MPPKNLSSRLAGLTKQSYLQIRCCEVFCCPRYSTSVGSFGSNRRNPPCSGHIRIFFQNWNIFFPIKKWWQFRCPFRASWFALFRDIEATASIKHAQTVGDHEKKLMLIFVLNAKNQSKKPKILILLTTYKLAMSCFLSEVRLLAWIWIKLRFVVNVKTTDSELGV